MVILIYPIVTGIFITHLIMLSMGFKNLSTVTGFHIVRPTRDDPLILVQSVTPHCIR